MKRKTEFILALIGVIISFLYAVIVLGFSTEGALTGIVSAIALGGTILLGLNKKRKLAGTLLLVAAIIDFIVLGNILTSALFTVAGVMLFIKK
ncbi:hypothetical protein AZF37_06545 [endosymbiont 'TC1' of Trimyema compressum]|uniref:hypothetical protein n=1 Tax=endosymbiont 'TC1' of Trimyema compressum TaxID=243899 RepID=UPI0007F0F9F4|nr:hypothetical protein [endosymbiont 'TC1' of Trimyema compressum]AMP20871.1 hypothetical protein AZF37_06545 [endosymbiont 'TC1' of Trimyema compressum]